MFDIGMSELILLLIIGLIAIGPKQLPEVAVKVARFINDFKRVVGEFTAEFTKVRDQTQTVFKDTQRDIEKALEEKTPPPTYSSPDDVPNINVSSEPPKRTEGDNSGNS